MIEIWVRKLLKNAFFLIVVMTLSNVNGSVPKFGD